MAKSYSLESEFVSMERMGVDGSSTRSVALLTDRFRVDEGLEEEFCFADER